VRASRGYWLLLLLMLPAACARRTGRGGRGAHGRRRHERHKEFNARATRDRPRGAGTGCPPAQRRVNPRSNRRRFPPPLAGRPARLRLIGRLPAQIDAARRVRGVARRAGDGVTDVCFYDGSAQPLPCARAGCVMRA